MSGATGSHTSGVKSKGRSTAWRCCQHRHRPPVVPQTPPPTCRHGPCSPCLGSAPPPAVQCIAHASNGTHARWPTSKWPHVQSALSQHRWLDRLLLSNFGCNQGLRGGKPSMRCNLTRRIQRLRSVMYTAHCTLPHPITGASTRWCWTTLLAAAVFVIYLSRDGAQPADGALHGRSERPVQLGVGARRVCAHQRPVGLRQRVELHLRGRRIPVDEACLCCESQAVGVLHLGSSSSLHLWLTWGLVRQKIIGQGQMSRGAVQDQCFGRSKASTTKTQADLATSSMLCASSNIRTAPRTLICRAARITGYTR